MNLLKFTVAGLLAIMLLPTQLPAQTEGTLFAIAGNGNLLTIDPITGDANFIGPSTFNFSGLAFDTSTRTLFGTIGRRVAEVNQETGEFTLITDTLPVDLQVNRLAFDSSTETLFGLDTDSGNLTTIDPASGELELVGTTGLTDITGLTYDPAANVFLAIVDDSSSFPPQLVEIDPETAAATVIGNIDVDDLVLSLALDTETNTLFAAGVFGSQLFTIDRSTASSTLVSAIGSGGPFSLLVISLAFAPPAAIPEPSSAVLLLVTGGGLLVRRRRNNR